VEYAIEAIKLGSTAIGICTSEGVVLAVEKRITSPLMELTTIEKIVEVDKHIGKNLVYRRKSLHGVRVPLEKLVR
jgi:20S proteasome subunit alpha 5